MKFATLTRSQKKQYDADFLVTLDFNDVAAQGAVDTGAAVSVLPGTTNGQAPAAGIGGTDLMPAGTKVALVAVVQEALFVSNSASTTTLTLSIGDGNSTARFGGPTLGLAGGVRTYATGTIANQPFVYTAADTVDVIFVSDGEDPGQFHLNTFTAGKVRLYFKYENMNRLPKI